MSAKTKARVFVPLKKVDEEQRLVFGQATAEVLDKAGEMMDYTSSKPLFEEWSGGIEKASGGLSKGNVRVMHGLVAAGKLTDISYDDDAKTIDVCAKIVDDQEWQKVLEGVYTGFSVGGSYEKKWTETVDGKKVKKFTARPQEISIVDNPCVNTACFSLVKADGTEEQKLFKSVETAEEPAAAAEPAEYVPTNVEIAAKAEELAKAAGKTEKDWGEFLDPAREELIKEAAEKASKSDDKEANKEKKAEGEEDDDDADDEKKTGEDDSDDKSEKTEKTTPAGVKQVWTASDGQTFEKKAEAEAHEATLTPTEETEADKLRKALTRAAEAIDEAEQAGGEESVFDDFDRLEKAFLELEQPREANGVPKLEKGMYTVSCFATTLSEVARLARTIKKEGKIEGEDAADFASYDKIKEALTTFSEAFKVYAENQIAEMLAGMDLNVYTDTYAYYAAAAEKDPENVLAKDVCSVLDRVKDKVPEKKETLAKLWSGKMIEPGDVEGEVIPLAKFTKLEAEHEELKKVAQEAAEQVGGLVKRVKALEDTPLPRAPKGTPVTKEGDNSFFKGAQTEDEKLQVVADLVKEYGPDALATMMIKASHAGGGHKLGLTR